MVELEPGDRRADAAGDRLLVVVNDVSEGAGDEGGEERTVWEVSESRLSSVDDMVAWVGTVRTP